MRSVRIVGLVASCVVVGFFLAGWLGRRFLVSPDAGLAGPAIALAYGVLGAAAGGLAGIALVRRLPAPGRARALLALGPLALLLVGAGVWAYLAARAEYSAQLAEAYARLPPFRFELTHLPPLDDRPFARFAFDGATNRFTAVTPDGATCEGTLPGPDEVALLTTLRDIEVLLVEPLPCAERGTPRHRLAFAVDDRHLAAPPERAPAGVLALTADCLAEHAALRAAVDTAEAVYDRHRCW